MNARATLMQHLDIGYSVNDASKKFYTTVLPMGISLTLRGYAICSIKNTSYLSSAATKYICSKSSWLSNDSKIC